MKLATLQKLNGLLAELGVLRAEVGIYCGGPGDEDPLLGELVHLVYDLVEILAGDEEVRP